MVQMKVEAPVRAELAGDSEGVHKFLDASAMWQSLELLRPSTPSEWFAQNELFRYERCRNEGQLSRSLEMACIEWMEGAEPALGPCFARFVARDRAQKKLVEVAFARRMAANGNAVWTLEVNASGLDVGRVTALVRCWGPAWGRVASHPSSSHPRGVGRHPRVGWLTYLSRSHGPLPPIPPPTQVVPVDDLGWILVAQPDPMDEAKPEHQASLAYVRHALGARVLRDGPAFPPAAVPEAVTAAVAPKDLDPAPSEVPSYLKAPVAAELTPPPIRVAPAPAAAAPFVAVTVDIDLAKILKSSVPFDSKAAPRTLPATAQPAAQSRVPTAGETKELDVFEIVKRDPAVPFGTPVAVAVARGAAPERASAELPAAPQGKRWKLFDPQTGRPLAVPVLEAIPPAPPATPSGVPAETIGSPAVLAGATGTLGDRKPDGYTETLELDPALLAAVLKKPAAPFRR